MPASPPPITATVGFWFVLAKLMSADAQFLSPGDQFSRRCQGARARRTRHNYVLRFVPAIAGRFLPASTTLAGCRHRSGATVLLLNGSTPARAGPRTQALAEVQSRHSRCSIHLLPRRSDVDLQPANRRAPTGCLLSRRG